MCYVQGETGNLFLVMFSLPRSDFTCWSDYNLTAYAKKGDAAIKFLLKQGLRPGPTCQQVAFL